jgi:hypothetical protein
LARQGKAFILGEVSLTKDPTLQYCVKSMLLEMNERIQGVYFGIFAHIGPYIVDVSSRYIDDYFWDPNKFEKEGGHYIIKPQVNFETLERISPLPSGCDTVVLIAWGDPRFRPDTIPRELTDLKLLIDTFNAKGVPKTWEEVSDHYYKGMTLVLHQYKLMD